LIANIKEDILLGLLINAPVSGMAPFCFSVLERHAINQHGEKTQCWSWRPTLILEELSDQVNFALTQFVSAWFL
jgi:hypothetical protein